MAEYHKALQQQASRGASLTKTPTTQATHFFAARMAYSKREMLKLKHGGGYFRLKAQRYAVGLKVMFQQLAQLAA